MTEPRELAATLNAILLAIPADQRLLRVQLESVRQSAIYQPPEQQAHLWQRAAERLNAHGVSAETDWGQAVLKIWSGQ